MEATWGCTTTPSTTQAGPPCGTTTGTSGSGPGLCVRAPDSMLSQARPCADDQSTQPALRLTVNTPPLTGLIFHGRRIPYDLPYAACCVDYTTVLIITTCSLASHQAPSRHLSSLAPPFSKRIAILPPTFSPFGNTRRRSDYMLVNTAVKPAPKQIPFWQGMQQSQFCFAPLGQSGGEPDRYSE